MPPTPPIREYGWMSKVARKIIREGKNFLLACDEIGVELEGAVEATRIQQSDVFQTILRQERLRYGTEISNDPLFGKQAAIGLMAVAIQKLMDEGEWEKAVEAWLKVSKLAGWTAPEQAVTVFADLRGKDIENLKREIALRTSKTGTKEALN